MKIGSCRPDVFLSSTEIVSLCPLESTRLGLEEEVLLLFCSRASSSILSIFLILVEVVAVVEEVGTGRVQCLFIEGC